MAEKEITTGENGELYIEHNGKFYRMPKGRTFSYETDDQEESTGSDELNEKRIAISVSQAKEDDGTKVVISDCTFFTNGFDPLTEAVRTLTRKESTGSDELIAILFSLSSSEPVDSSWSSVS